MSSEPFSCTDFVQSALCVAEYENIVELIVENINDPLHSLYEATTRPRHLE